MAIIFGLLLPSEEETVFIEGMTTTNARTKKNYSHKIVILFTYYVVSIACIHIYESNRDTHQKNSRKKKFYSEWEIKRQQKFALISSCLEGEFVCYFPMCTLLYSLSLSGFRCSFSLLHIVWRLAAWLTFWQWHVNSIYTRYSIWWRREKFRSMLFSFSFLFVSFRFCLLLF